MTNKYSQHVLVVVDEAVGIDERIFKEGIESMNLSGNQPKSHPELYYCWGGLNNSEFHEVLPHGYQLIDINTDCQVCVADYMFDFTDEVILTEMRETVNKKLKNYLALKARRSYLQEIYTK